MRFGKKVAGTWLSRRLNIAFYSSPDQKWANHFDYNKAVSYVWLGLTTIPGSSTS